MLSKTVKANEKRPRKSLSLDQRVEVIQQYGKLRSTRQLARIYKCSLSQIKNIIRRKDEYLDEWNSNGNLKRIKWRQSANFVTVGTVVCEWIRRCRLIGINVTDEKIRDTGKLVIEKLKLPQIRPTNTWLQRLKERFQLDSFDVDLINHSERKQTYSVDIDDIIQELKTETDAVPIPQSMLVLPKQNITQNSEENSSDEYPSPCENNYECGKINSLIHPIVNLTNVKNESTQIYSKRDELHSGDFSSNYDSTVESEQINGHTVPSHFHGRSFNAGLRTFTDAYNTLSQIEEFALSQGDIKALSMLNHLKMHYLSKFPGNTNPLF